MHKFIWTVRSCYVSRKAAVPFPGLFQNGAEIVCSYVENIQNWLGTKFCWQITEQGIVTEVAYRTYPQMHSCKMDQPYANDI